MDKTRLALLATTLLLTACKSKAPSVATAAECETTTTMVDRFLDSYGSKTRDADAFKRLRDEVHLPIKAKVAKRCVDEKWLATSISCMNASKAEPGAEDCPKDARNAIKRGVEADVTEAVMARVKERDAEQAKAAAAQAAADQASSGAPATEAECNTLASDIAVRFIGKLTDEKRKLALMKKFKDAQKKLTERCVAEKWTVEDLKCTQELLVPNSGRDDCAAGSRAITQGTLETLSSFE
jgi:hypothetical protein